MSPARLSCIAIAIALGLWQPPASAASFDCRKATTSTEKLVCSNPTLSRLDEQLDDAYKVAQTRVAARTALRDAQRVWLATRRDVCRDAACLRTAYLARIDALLDESTATNQTLGINALKARETYAAPKGSCGGFPRLRIDMADGMCAGLVLGPTQADPTRRIRMPRQLLELDERTWLVSDLGAWQGKLGAVWRIRLNADHSTSVDALVKDLSLPHSLALGPDGRVYASEMGRIFSFDPNASGPSATVQTVIGHLPDNSLHEHRHPIASFIFDADGALLVNVGAPSDECLDAAGKPAGPNCKESEGSEHTAGIRRYAMTGPGKWSQEYTVFARGLRNSVAMARHRSGTILQGENSYDFEARLRPYEEINVIEAGRHYGWPYCYDLSSPAPGWKNSPYAKCASARFTPPALLLPPHSAPLSMLWYQGAMFPQLRGQLLVSLHGFRSVGGRIVAYQTDAKGIPKRNAGAKFAAYRSKPFSYGSPAAAKAFVLTPGWDKVVDLRPQGSPVALAVAKDGSIWTTDDRAGLVIRIAADPP